MRSDGRRQIDRRQRDRRDEANSRFYSILRKRLKTGRYNLHCSRRHKSATTALLCFTQHLCIADNDVQLSDTHTMNFCFLTANDLCEHTAMLRYTYTAQHLITCSIYRHLHFFLCMVHRCFVGRVAQSV